VQEADLDQHVANAYLTNTERKSNQRRSTTVPPQMPMNSNPPITSPRNTYRSTKDVLGADGATLVGITDIAIRSNSKPGSQSQNKLSSTAGMDTLRQNSQSSAGIYAGEYSNTRTLKTMTQWYLKSPAKNATFYDQSYKVVPTLNHGQRVNKLDQITKEN